MRGVVRWIRAVVAAVCLCACGPAKDQPSRAASPASHGAGPSAVSPAKASPQALARAEVPAHADAASEWETVRLDDEAPLCVFSDLIARANAPFPSDAHKQTLRADTRVVFGAFSPGCRNEACDRAPTLQCWVESMAANTLVVHSRLSFGHKRDSVCSENCRSVIAGCETEPLKRGEYRVEYGSRSFSLRIPSVMRDPCLAMK